MGEEENVAFQCQRDKRKTRIELVTYRAAIDCSTTELFPLKLQRDESNIRPSGHEPDTLPTELRCMVTLTGVEPATSGLWVRHSSVELQCIAWISYNPISNVFITKLSILYIPFSCSDRATTLANPFSYLSKHAIVNSLIINTFA